MNAMPPDEPEHDAMLRAALRHAPDRDARPPEAVSAQILRRAQQATASSSSGRALGAVMRWLTALTRPAPAAAFASLMLATVIGVVWREGPPPERRDDRDPLAAQVRLEAPRAASEAGANGRDAAPGTEADSGQALRSAEVETSTALPKRNAVPPAPTAPAARSPSTRNTPPAEAVAAAKAATAPPAGTAAAPSAAPPEAVAQAELRREPAPTSGAAPAPATAAPADTAAAPARPAEDEARRASNRPDAKTAAEAGAARGRDSAAPASPQAAIAGRSDAARARSEPIGPARNMLAAAADPLAALVEGWAGASEAQRAALDELRRLSAGRWTRVPAAEVPPSAELSGADGRPLGRAAITDDAVLWLPANADALAWRAPLEPAVAADLRRRLALPPGR